MEKTLSLIAGVVVLGSLSGNAVAEPPGEETIQKCTQVLAANPQDASAYAERAKAYFIAQDCEEALRDFSKAITINDSDASYYGGRGDAYRALRQDELAVSDYTKALELGGENPHYFGMRGNCYKNLGKREEAIADMQKALELGYPGAEDYFKARIAQMQAQLNGTTIAPPSSPDPNTLKEIYPVKVGYPGEPFAALKALGVWTEINGSLASSGQGFESIGPANPSALKNIIAEATFGFKDAETKGAAGVQFGFGNGPDQRWTFMYFPSEEKVKLEFRQKNSVRLVQSFNKKLTPPYNLRAEVKSAGEGEGRLVANGETLAEGKIFGGIPVFKHSGAVSVDAAALFSKLSVRGGEYVRPVIAIGDSITHHCRWQSAVSEITGVPITNAGLAGEDSGSARSRFESDVVALQPKFVFIYTGTNDGGSQSALTNVKAMAEVARKAGIPFVICGLIPNQAQPKIEEFNKAIREYAAAEKVTLVDWNSVLNNGANRIKPEFGDEVHPNPKGARLMAEFCCAQPDVRKLLDALK